MLAIQKKNQSQQCTPNVLPCRIAHDGPLPPVERFWKPQQAEDGTVTAYFRGRKLQGKNIKIPEASRGVILQMTEKVLPQSSSKEEEDDDDEAMEDVKIAEEVASFDEITVWGHEAVPTDAENAYSKGIEEWMRLAHSIHVCPDEDTNDTKQT